MAEHTKAKPVRIHEDIWKAYEQVCQRLGTNRSERINALIAQDIVEHGTDAEREMLDAARAEMAARLSRKTGRPRKLKEVEAARALLGEGASVAKVAEVFRVEEGEVRRALEL
ncbi:hypothetical protein [Nocardiopsis synnemataformans]|uniref:hypothetical protein n=1 Tax=Nocardiopsis synnemataformans TaxID=61305 RepID=UPI003EBB7298